ncbi:MAG: hypothetical protein U0165_06550 [Polyangiaceae bacterium]
MTIFRRYGLIVSCSALATMAGCIAFDGYDFGGYTEQPASTGGTAGTGGTGGTSGTSGSAGASGSGGSSGTAGSSGAAGTAGTNGASGSAGTGGASGSSGAGGSSGTGGTSGVGGSAGAGGTSGVAGSAGTSGTAGAGGTSGSAGTGGTGGSSGTAGTAGSSGTGGTAGCDNPTAYLRDFDMDGYGGTSPPVMSCAPPAQESGFNWVTQGNDCDDARNNVHPGQTNNSQGFISGYPKSGWSSDNTSFDYDCDGTETVTNNPAFVAAQTCSGLLSDCGGKSGYLPSPRTGANVNPLCGSTSYRKCASNGISCSASTITAAAVSCY